jgi:2-polyprenyl-3-methyl-5-hydroxy-6-metoxy-1,4-benzoquinol methylase
MTEASKLALGKSPMEDEDYLRFLKTVYGGKSAGYYRQFLTLPLQPSIHILDWGCGLGGMLETVATLEPTASIHALDLNPQCVADVRSRHPNWDIRLLQLPGLKSDFEDARFDRVFLLDVIEHCPEPQLLLRECHRILKPGGVLTLSTPDRWAFHKPKSGLVANVAFNIRHMLKKEWLDPTHVTEYTYWELNSLLNASPFASHDMQASVWRFIPWLRPPKRYYGFTVNVRKG